MDDSFAFIIPGEPVAKERPRSRIVGGKVHTFTAGKTRAWAAMAVARLKASWGSRAPIEEAVEVSILAIKTRPQRLHRKNDPPGLIWRTAKPDRDNVDKAVLDALVSAGVLKDDIYVVCGECLNLFTEKGGKPGVEITIRRAPPLDDRLRALWAKRVTS